MKIHLQRNSDGANVTIEDDLIIRAYTVDSVTTVEYLTEEDGYRKMLGVSETLANVGAESKNLVLATVVTVPDLVVDSGDASGTTAFKLVDLGQNFLTTVNVGMRVKNTTDGTYATVEAVDSNTQLSLNVDIMVSGDDFVIYSDAGSTAWVNRNRIGSMYEENELGILMLDTGGQGLSRVDLQSNLTVFKTAMAAKDGDTTYAIASYTAAPNTIVLASAEGDVTANFTAGDTFTVYGENTVNDSIYSVVSVAFGLVTTITVAETPTAATAYGGRIRKRS
tara:strand:+ start:10261 stop:11097 length:837 start_codon:yes stop_codon:yes gene_type:complete